jgi:hypothetical protein
MLLRLQLRIVHGATCGSTVTIDLGVCRNRVGFCRTCIALLAVGVLFIGMYMFIRVTYFIGYKS